MAKRKTLNEAMDAGDELAEAEIRYRLLAEAFEETPGLRSNLNGQLDRAKAEILRLRAARSGATTEGKVVAIDAGRFRKSRQKVGNQHQLRDADRIDTNEGDRA